MQEKKKSGPVCCGQNLRKLRFYRGVSYVALCLGIGGGLGWLGLENMAQAAICFLPDCGDKILEFQGDANLSTQYCRDAGYTYYELGQCPPYYHQEVCPENSHYLKCDAQKWCEDNGYNTLPEECVVPQYADEQCLNGLNFYKQCKEDLARACSEENPDYVSECQEGWKLDDDELCSYSPLYGKCCNECEDYPYEEDEIPQGYQKGESCLACGDITKYTAKLKDCAGDGFIQCANGGKTGTEVCWRGDEKWYKECCAPCDDYPYLESQIPEGYVKGDSCDSCDGMKYKTKVGECATDYKWENGACVSACDKTCSVGNILYSDMTCNSCLVSGKTPIGVVSYANGSTRLAIQLDNPGKMPWTQNRVYIRNISDISSGANNDFYGKSNTLAWVAYNGEDTTFAPGYCYNYTTEGTSKGQWYLPAGGELYNLLPNNSAINRGLSVANAIELSETARFWSSTAHNYSGAWLAYVDKKSLAHIYTIGNTTPNSVRCVLPLEITDDETVYACDADYKYTCSGNGYIGGIGTDCGGMYSACTCAEGYVWRYGECIPCDSTMSCCVGDIINSDATCTQTKVSDKRAIGVVSYAKGNYLLAMQLDEPPTMKWSNYNFFDIYEIPYLSPYKEDFDGKAHTAVWMTYFGEDSTFAPGYCYNYTTEGTDKGQWYLPAAGELYALTYSYRPAVMAGLSESEGIQITKDMEIWSSSEYDEYYTISWVPIPYAMSSRGSKSNAAHVRCIIAFELNSSGSLQPCGADYKYRCENVPNSKSGVGSDCGGLYSSCTCESGYAWRYGRCAPCDNTMSCCVGDILNSDLTCSSEKIEGKTPIGVVSYISGDTRLAIQLDGASNEMRWGSSDVDLADIIDYERVEVLNDFSGKDNTAAWVSYYGSSVTGYAPGYCYNYTTSGTSKGDWYLPAAGELYASTVINYSVVNGGIKAAEGTPINMFTPHISSSELSPWSDVCFVYSLRGNPQPFSKTSNKAFVRCVLAF